MISRPRLPRQALARLDYPRAVGWPAEFMQTFVAPGNLRSCSRVLNAVVLSFPMWFPFVGLAAEYCSTVTGAKPLFHLFQHKNATAPLILLGAVEFRGQKPGIIQRAELLRTTGMRPERFNAETPTKDVPPRARPLASLLTHPCDSAFSGVRPVSRGRDRRGSADRSRSRQRRGFRRH